MTFKISSVLLVLAISSHVTDAHMPDGLQLGPAPGSKRRHLQGFPPPGGGGGGRPPPGGGGGGRPPPGGGGGGGGRPGGGGGGGGQARYCSSLTPNFAASGNGATGQCLNFSRGRTYQYPQDFISTSGQSVRNQVQEYVCPTSQKRVIISNNIPNHDHRQGNPNAPCEQLRYIELPLNPTYMSGITEVPPMGMLAMATNGVAAFGAMEGEGGNALDPNGQFVDASFWYGHATFTGEDHYHNPQMGVESTSSVGENKLLAYALDGFPIYGFTNQALDECNGRFAGGEYRYHVRRVDEVALNSDYCGSISGSNNWNYILGCYHGDTRQTRYGSSAGYRIPSDCREVGDATPSQPTRAPSVAGPTPADPVAEEQSCEDSNENCELWASTGECENNPTFMLDDCARACNACVDPSCSDRADSCNAWASNGECEDNPLYMIQFCTRSCDACNAPAPAPPQDRKLLRAANLG